ncbi:MAG TPA: HEAT repeat domain-containing protein [Acidobacteriota bacterium]|nr:HEAT repeat domain-containing protein [Acidobacteriota bacterium]HMZ82221.1 HEAT repeat domain-containing protein [Acidobacteriota bacterium]HNC44440.1 HEAT repeat domain-containing protein [Acidobacteriota bacterium]
MPHSQKPPSLSLAELHEQIDQACDTLRQHNHHVLQETAKTLAALGLAAVEPLMEKLHDPDRYVQDVVARALGQLGDSRPVVLLLEIIKDYQPLSDDEKDEEDLSEPEFRAVEALGKIGDRRVVEPLLDELDRLVAIQPDVVTTEIIYCLGEIGDRRALETCLRFLKPPLVDHSHWKAAHYALPKFGEPAVAPLIELLNEVDDPLIAYDLAEIGHPSAIPVLYEVLEDTWRPDHLRANAAHALGKLKAPNAFETLLRLLNHEADNPNLLRGVILGLGNTQDERALEALLKLFDHPFDQALFGWIIEALGELGTSGAIDVLVVLLDSQDMHIRQLAIRALERGGDERAIPALQLLVDDYERPTSLMLDETTEAGIKQMLGPDGVDEVLDLFGEGTRRWAASAIRAIRQRSQISLFDNSGEFDSQLTN